MSQPICERKGLDLYSSPLIHATGHSALMNCCVNAGTVDAI
jgi:hypothetical protein